MSEIHRGDVWWADVPGDKRRPVLVLTRERFVPHLSSLLVAPLTTTVRDIPTEVKLDVDDGLPKPCAVSLDNVFTLERRRLVDHVTSLEDDALDEVCAALAFAVGC